MMNKPFIRYVPNKFSQNRGSGLLEAAITVPVFLVVVMMVVDITRYFVAYNLLNYAAFSAADLASKYEIETDTRPDAVTCPDDNSSDNPCARYCRRIKKVLETADSIASSMASKAPGIGSLKRIPIHHYSDSSTDQKFGERIVDCALTDLDSYGVGFIRPGEKVTTGDATPVVIDHPTRPFSSGWPTATNGGPWTSVLAEHPFQIVMEADFVPVMPLIGTIRMKIRQSAYRRSAGFAKSFRKGDCDEGGCSGTSGPSGPPASPVPTATPMPTCPTCCKNGGLQGLITCDSGSPEFLQCVQCYCVGGCGS